MKRLYSYISSVIVVVFIFSSILQFHHHDINGNIDLLSFNAETCITHHQYCHVETPDAHHESHSSDDENCALKLSVQKAARQTTLDNIVVLDLSYILGYITEVNNILSLTHATIIPIEKSIGTIGKCKVHSKDLRAPPCFI